MLTFNQVRMHWAFQCVVAWCAIVVMFSLLPDLNLAKGLLIAAVVAIEIALFSERRELQRVSYAASGVLGLASAAVFALTKLR